MRIIWQIGRRMAVRSLHGIMIFRIMCGGLVKVNRGEWENISNVKLLCNKVLFKLVHKLK